MATLLYHWDFTGSDTITINQTEFVDKVSEGSDTEIKAKVLSRGTISTSTVSQSTDGITLDNTDSDGGIYIDLYGLDSVNLGGNVTIEIVLKNAKTGRNGVLYFQTIRDVQDEVNNDSAVLSCKYNQSGKVAFLARTDEKSSNGVSYDYKKAITNADTINNTDFFHYTYTLSYTDNSNNSINLYVNGSKEASNTGLQLPLSNTVRQSNLIGTQKDATGANYLNGTIRYIKIYENAMDDDEVESAYNNYYWNEDFSSSTDSEKYSRRHSDVDDYFSTHSNKTSFITRGSQLGLINSDENYTIHKFTNGETIDINSGFHYIPLSGQNQYIILQNGSKWYKITQTSSTDGSGSTYKYETSTDGDNFSDAVEDKGFGDTVEIDNITLGFGGVESGATSSGDICFLGSELVLTDQGKIRIDKLTTNNTIYNYKIQKIVKVFNSDDSLILIYKDALGPNIPSKNTFISINHGIYLDNCFIDKYKLKTSYNNVNFKIKGKNMVRARDLTVLPKIIKITKIGRHKIYNVLLDVHYKMNVNGLICETLHPLSIKK